MSYRNWHISEVEVEGYGCQQALCGEYFLAADPDEADEFPSKWHPVAVLLANEPGVGYGWYFIFADGEGVAHLFQEPLELEMLSPESEYGIPSQCREWALKQTRRVVEDSHDNVSAELMDDLATAGLVKPRYTWVGP